MLTVGSLFSGIGGLDLGFERAGGFRVEWFCDIDPCARVVLRDRWPGVPIHHDVQTLTRETVAPVDVLAGGFPCQGISPDGKRQGLADPRSGLWSEFARLIRVLRPRYVVVENSADLPKRGLVTVLGDLASAGYDAEWAPLQGAHVGLPHERERCFVLAYPRGDERQQGGAEEDQRGADAVRHGSQVGEAPLEYPHGPRRERRWLHRQGLGARRAGVGGQARPAELAHTDARRRRAGQRALQAGQPHLARSGASARGPPLRHVPPPPHEDDDEAWDAYLARYPGLEPVVRRGPHGIPHRVDRLRLLGNAVIPQVAEIVARRILEREHHLRERSGFSPIEAFLRGGQA